MSSVPEYFNKVIRLYAFRVLNGTNVEMGK